MSRVVEVCRRAGVQLARLANTAVLATAGLPLRLRAGGTDVLFDMGLAWKAAATRRSQRADLAVPQA